MALGIRKADVGQVARDITGGKVEGPVERDRQVRKIPANSVAALKNVPRGEVRPT